eukprot:5596233-Amphidinium_carterae.1
MEEIANVAWSFTTVMFEDDQLLQALVQAASIQAYECSHPSSEETRAAELKTRRDLNKST